MRRSSATRLTVALVSLALATGAAATTWYVPGDANTIQGGIDLSTDGDTVRVACGTYVEHDLAITQGVVLISETGDPGCVTVDADGRGRVLSMELATGAPRIEGLTLTGGVTEAIDDVPGWGGGILCLGTAASITRCVFDGNQAYGGGGLAAVGHAAPTISACTFTGNAAHDGGGLLCLVGTHVVTDCTFTGNAADSLGGAVHAVLGVVDVAGSTFHGNAAPFGGGVASGVFESVFEMNRSILSFSTAGDAVSCDEQSHAALACSDVFGNAGGDFVGCLAGQDGTSGNFSADPLFCDAASGDVRLAPTSPCLPGQHPDGAACEQIGAHGACDVLAAGEAPATSARPSLHAHPNPARGAIVLRYEAGPDRDAVVSIFDLAGRRVRAFSPVRGAGTIIWDATDLAGRAVAAGTSYFVRIRTGHTERTLRLTLLE